MESEENEKPKSAKKATTSKSKTVKSKPKTSKVTKTKDSNELQKTKRTRNVSKQESELRKELGNSKDAIKYLTVRKGLDGVMKKCEEKKKWLTMFRTLSKSAGIYRYYVGLFSNYMIMKILETNDPNTPIIDKSFYDRCWSTLENSCKIANTFPFYKQYFDDFKATTGFSDSLLKIQVDYEMRSAITKEMTTSAHNNLKLNFEGRIKKIISSVYHRVYYNKFQAATRQEKAKKPLDGLEDKERLSRWIIINKLVKCVIQDTNVPETLCSHPRILQLVHDCRLNINYIKRLALIRKNERDEKKEKPQTHISLEAAVIECTVESMKVMASISKTIEKLNNDRLTTKKGKNIKLFNVLPIWKLQPAFITINNTILENCKLNTKKLDFNGIVSYWFRDIEKQIPQLNHEKRPNSILGSFQTNGVDIQFRIFMLGCEPVANLASLAKKGYSALAAPSTLIPVTKRNGLYRTTQERFDIKTLTKQQLKEYKDLIITTVDTGNVDVVSVLEVKLKDAHCIHKILDNGKFWSLSNDEYCKQSNRNTFSKREAKRRDTRVRCYGTIIEKMSLSKKKTTSVDVFVKYLKVAISNGRTLINELTSVGRRKTKFFAQNCLHSAIAKLANKLAKKKKSENKIVFFGDGTFGHSKGCAPVPKKKIVHQLATRVLTSMLAEYGTSQYCPDPTCQFKVKNIEGDYRMRRCESDSRAETPCYFSTHSTNRDKISTMCMCHIAYTALTERSKIKKRPRKYCRNF
jgi:hypothetical protein